MRRWWRACGWRVRGWLGRRGFRVGIGLVWFVGRGGGEEGRGVGFKKKPLRNILFYGDWWDRIGMDNLVLFFFVFVHQAKARQHCIASSYYLLLNQTIYDPNLPPFFPFFLSFFLTSLFHLPPEPIPTHSLTSSTHSTANAPPPSPSPPHRYNG